MIVMSSACRNNIIRQKQLCGASAIEYLVGLAALLTALLAPVFNGKSAADLLVDAIKHEHAGYSYAISKP